MWNLFIFFIRFAAAAIAAFGAISLDHRTEKVPIDSKTKFNEVAEEKALILHDNLEVRDRWARAIVWHCCVLLTGGVYSRYMGIEQKIVKMQRGIRETLTGYGIWLLPGKRNSPKFGTGRRSGKENGIHWR